MSEEGAAAPDISGIGEADAAELAAMVAASSDEQLAAGLEDPGARGRVLGEIFKRMADHVEPGAIEGLEAVVHFRITDGPDGAIDVYEAIFADGRVEVSDRPETEEPRVSIQIGPVHFLRLVTGAASGPAMFMTGKLKLRGDMMFASRMTSLFRIPTSA